MRERSDVETIWTAYVIESSYGLYINFENSRRGWGDLLIFAAEETTVLCKFPCLFC